MRALFLLALCVLALSSDGQAIAAEGYAKRIAEHGVWSVYDYDLGDRTVCFAAARPKSTKPEGAVRAPVRAYISTWPDIEPGNPGHLRELSFRIGTAVKSANLKVDGKPFTLFGDGQDAFVFEISEEEKIVAAMKKGKSISITAVDDEGGVTTDRYSLSGLTAAIKSLDNLCGAGRIRGKPGLDPACVKAWTKLSGKQTVKAKQMIAKGTDYAKANYSKDQLGLIKDYFAMTETMKFRCPGYTPPPKINPKR